MAMKARKYTIFICFLFGLSCLMELKAVAEPSEVVREVKGYGLSREMAVNNALIEAIQQVKGLKIEASKSLNTAFKEEMKEHNGKEENRSIFSEDQQKRILSQTQGHVTSYEVLTMEKDGAGQGWEALLLVHIPDYKTPGISPDSRRKMAIIPFRSTQDSYNFRGEQIPATEISRQFTQKIITEMTQARRFTVLDREYIEVYLREKNMLLSGDTPIEEQMKIGEVLGVDYLVVGTISEAELARNKYTIQVTGETGYNFNATLIADYRIVVMATRQIKWADNVTITMDNNDIKALVPNLRGDLAQQALLATAAKEIVHKAMDNIYPLRVVKVLPNGKIILNQGGVTISDGDKLEIFAKGEQIIDPYTKESLGAAESWVATIETTRILPKISYATVIKGNISSIQKGSICRRIKTKKTEQEISGRTTDVIISNQEGVVLPFD